MSADCYHQPIANYTDVIVTTNFHTDIKFEFCVCKLVSTFYKKSTKQVNFNFNKKVKIKLVLQIGMNEGGRPHVKSHYRGHYMSVWLQLIPQLHQPGPGQVIVAHHQFDHNIETAFYEGKSSNMVNQAKTQVPF